MPRQPKPMTERELLSVLRSEKGAADSFMNSTAVADQRARTMKAYTGGKIVPNDRDRSGVNDRTVFETVEWVMPQLMEMFAGSEDVVEFNPEGPEDVGAAEQATDYLNYVMMRQNNGFLVYHDWFKDVLLQKYGVVKVFWETNRIPETFTYNNIDDEELTLLIEPDNVELLEVIQTGEVAVVGEDGQPDSRPVYSASIAVYEDRGRAKVEVTDPSRFLVRVGTEDLKDADFVGEVFDATATDLIKSGFPGEKIAQVNFDDSDSRSLIGNQVKDARHAFDDSHSGAGGTGVSHESMRTAEITEAYIRIDANGDGISELLQVFYTDSVILSMEEVDDIPYVDMNAIRIPHKLIGMSIADVVIELEEIRTVLIRGILDHMYATNNGRYAVVEGAVNMSDLLDPVPGGFVRQSAPGMVEPLQTDNLDPNTFSLLQYLDGVKEDRAGVNKVQQGVDKTALGSNVMTGAMDRAMTAAQSRIMMLARMFAETGVKELYWKLYGLVRKNQMEPEVVRLRNKFAEVRPMDWKHRSDMTVRVGVGNTSPAQKVQELVMLRDSLSMAAEAGIVQPQNVYNFMAEFAKAIGRQDWDKFITQPPENPPPPEPTIDQQIQLEEIKLKQQEQARKDREFELEQKKFEWEQIVNVAELELEDSQKRAVGLQAGK